MIIVMIFECTVFAENGRYIFFGSKKIDRWIIGGGFLKHGSSELKYVITEGVVNIASWF